MFPESKLSAGFKKWDGTNLWSINFWLSIPTLGTTILGDETRHYLGNYGGAS